MVSDPALLQSIIERFSVHPDPTILVDTNPYGLDIEMYYTNNYLGKGSKHYCFILYSMDDDQTEICWRFSFASFIDVFGDKTTEEFALFKNGEHIFNVHLKGSTRPAVIRFCESFIKYASIQIPKDSNDSTNT